MSLTTASHLKDRRRNHSSSTGESTVSQLLTLLQERFVF